MNASLTDGTGWTWKTSYKLEQLVAVYKTLCTCFFNVPKKCGQFYGAYCFLKWIWDKYKNSMVS